MDIIIGLIGYIFIGFLVAVGYNLVDREGDLDDYLGVYMLAWPFYIFGLLSMIIDEGTPKIVKRITGRDNKRTRL